MTKNPIHITLVTLIASMLSCWMTVVYAQEPNFSQFNYSPLSINPALSGSSDSDWRISSIIRRRWIGKVSPFSTQTISIDGKLKNFDEQRFLGIGGMVMAENAMDGLYRTNYINLNASYHQPIDENGNGLSASIGVINSASRLDLGSLSFDQQLFNAGFDRALPTGESSIGSKSSFTSATAGLLYSMDTENSFFSAGISGYRFLQTRRTFLNDTSQRISPRYTLHADFGKTISDKFSLNFNALYMVQNGSYMTSFGSILGIMLQEDDNAIDKFKMFNLGFYYRLNDAISPYLGYVYNNFQMGLSYDVNASASKGSASVYRSVELSLQYKKYLPTYRKRIGRFHSPY